MLIISNWISYFPFRMSSILSKQTAIRKHILYYSSKISCTFISQEGGYIIFQLHRKIFLLFTLSLPEQKMKVKLSENNQSEISVAQSPNFTSRTKNIPRAYYFLRVVRDKNIQSLLSSRRNRSLIFNKQFVCLSL